MACSVSFVVVVFVYSFSLVGLNLITLAGWFWTWKLLFPRLPVTLPFWNGTNIVFVFGWINYKQNSFSFRYGRSSHAWAFRFKRWSETRKETKRKKKKKKSLSPSLNAYIFIHILVLLYAIFFPSVSQMTWTDVTFVIKLEMLHPSGLCLMHL